ncbi:MAG TPA: alpha/beta hydrolase [Acidimicrobiales bacterium]|nr:alpha/beta hydrolase [Acidimicrobiales bacterium]
MWAAVMVMGRRPGVPRSSWPIAATDLAGLAGQLAAAMARVPFRRPWSGDGNLPHNLAVAVTRETIRSFMGYSSSLPIDEFRSVEMVLDDLCGVVLPPLTRGLGVTQQEASVAGVPGIWYRPEDGSVRGTVLYLHGGGYVGTSPRMYGLFVSWLCRQTRLEIFVADLRLAPEYPFPAGLEDAVVVLEALLVAGVHPSRLFVAGDSSGGGLAASLMYSMARTHHQPVAGVVLFSPELDLLLDEPSMTDNAALDILPWNIPTSAYLHGRSPGSAPVDALDQDLSGWPPTFVCFGRDEMFRDSIRRFVDRLVRSGVETSSLEGPGMFHVFPILMPWADASRQAFRSVAAFVDLHLPDADDGESRADPNGLVGSPVAGSRAGPG